MLEYINKHNLHFTSSVSLKTSQIIGFIMKQLFFRVTHAHKQTQPVQHERCCQRTSLMQPASQHGRLCFDRIPSHHKYPQPNSTHAISHQRPPKKTSLPSFCLCNRSTGRMYSHTLERRKPQCNLSCNRPIDNTTTAPPHPPGGMRDEMKKWRHVRA